MTHSPPTRASLLLRIRDPSDRIAWGEFVEVYAPLVHAYARSRGLQDADAADVAQEVLAAVAAHAGRFEYDATRGSFRGWLFRITLNKLRDLVARQRAHPAGSGDTAMHQRLVDAPAADGEGEWNEQYAWRVFLWAAEKAKVDFRPATWQAFWRTSVENEPVAAVARDLAISDGAVHIARCRVMARIKELVAAVEPPE